MLSKSISCFRLFRLFQKYGLTIKSFVHTKARDRKSSLDVHFSICMRHVWGFVNMRKNVISLLELYTALTANGGIAKCRGYTLRA